MFSVKWNSKEYLDRLNPVFSHRHGYLYVAIGYDCSNLYCPHRTRCPHKSNYKLHNTSVGIRKWIYDKLDKELSPYVFFDRRYSNLAGTIKCPYNVPREDTYNCWDCKYSDFENCTNADRNTAKYEETRDPDHPRRCKYFVLNPDYARYDKKTGEYL